MRASIGAGFAFASLVGWIIGVVQHDAPIDSYWPILPAFFFGLGTSLIVVQLPAWWVTLWVQVAEAERARSDARHYRSLWREEKEQSGEQSEIVIDPNAQRLYRWVEFWTTCLEYVAQHGDNFTYQGCLRAILTWPAFEKGFAEPFEDKGWLRASVERASTAPAEGWTAARMMGEIARGQFPPAPAGEPPALRQATENNSENKGKQSKTGKTVYATDK